MHSNSFFGDRCTSTHRKKDSNSQRALAAFTCAGTVLSVFRTDPCLFPRYETYSVKDYSLAQGKVIRYASQEGARMVGSQTKSQHHRWCFTIIFNCRSATGRLGLQLPFVNAKVGDGFFQRKIVTIEQLKAYRATVHQFKKEWISK